MSLLNSIQAGSPFISTMLRHCKSKM
jgi:hypothetical protein